LSAKTDNFFEYLNQKDWRSIVVLKEILKEYNDIRPNRKLFNDLNERLKDYFKFMDCLYDWKYIYKLKEGYLLYFVQLCDYLYGSDDLQMVEEDNHTRHGMWNTSWIGMMELDDFVYDKHVKSPKYKSTSYFANVSSLVSPKAINVSIPKQFEDLYVWYKSETRPLLDFTIKQQSKNKRKIWVFPQSENKLDFIGRAQLVTSYSKTDTYYAKGVRHDINQVWLIKGPFLEKESVLEFISFQNYKKAIGIPHIKCFMNQMLVDRWPERPGIGLRHKFKVDEKGYFLMCKSVISEKDLSITIHPGSKKWDSTPVVDAKKFSVSIIALTDTQMVHYMNAIGFRLKHNIGDLSDRNFIVVGDTVVSVDEAHTKQPCSLLRAFKLTKYNIFKERFELLKELLIPDMRKYIEQQLND